MSNSAHLKAAVNAHLASLQLGQREPANLYQPMAYLLALKGKRIRPVLTLLAYEAVTGQEPKSALNLAIAVELFHNFTLMHDDIMDRAPVRRGKATVHKVWNEDIAILSGDALFAFSMGLVVQDFPSMASRLGAEFSQVAMEVCEGQMEDMDLAQAAQVDIAQYLEMIRKKTAVLLGGCMSLGAIAGQASDPLMQQFKQFGENLGIGFQLQDDLMDAFPPEGFGKQVGGDIIENKKTYLWIKALELGNETQQKRLKSLYAEPGEGAGKVADVLNIFHELDIKAHTQSLIEHYFAQAHQASEALAQHTDFGPLKAYLQEILHRKI